MVSMGTLAVRYIWLSGKPRSVDRHGPDVQYILFIQIAIPYVKADDVKCRDSPVDVSILAITKILYASLISHFLVEDVPAAQDIFARKIFINLQEDIATIPPAAVDENEQGEPEGQNRQ
jgi:hypothetical protein